MIRTDYDENVDLLEITARQLNGEHIGRSITFQTHLSDDGPTLSLGAVQIVVTGRLRGIEHSIAPAVMLDIGSVDARQGGTVTFPIAPDHPVTILPKEQ